MPRFQDFDIGIAMDGIKCTEFNVDVDFDAAITTCYIESIIGKNFVCDFMNHSEDTDFAIKPTFDGAKLRPFFAEAGLKGHKAGLHLNTTFLRPFEFAPTLIIEDSTTNRTMPSDNGIGTLTFEIWRVKSVHRRDMDENQRGSKRRRTEDGSVVTAERIEPERREENPEIEEMEPLRWYNKQLAEDFNRRSVPANSDKAKFHRVNLGDRIRAPIANFDEVWSFAFLDSRPYHTIKIHYRPRDVLKNDLDINVDPEQHESRATSSRRIAKRPKRSPTHVRAGSSPPHARLEEFIYSHTPHVTVLARPSQDIRAASQVRTEQPASSNQANATSAVVAMAPIDEYLASVARQWDLPDVSAATAPAAPQESDMSGRSPRQEPATSNASNVMAPVLPQEPGPSRRSPSQQPAPLQPSSTTVPAPPQEPAANRRSPSPQPATSHASSATASAAPQEPGASRRSPSTQPATSHASSAVVSASPQEPDVSRRSPSPQPATSHASSVTSATAAAPPQEPDMSRRSPSPQPATSHAPSAMTFVAPQELGASRSGLSHATSAEVSASLQAPDTSRRSPSQQPATSHAPSTTAAAPPQEPGASRRSLSPQPAASHASVVTAPVPSQELDASRHGPSPQPAASHTSSAVVSVSPQEPDVSRRSPNQQPATSHASSAVISAPPQDPDAGRLSHRAARRRRTKRPEEQAAAVQQSRQASPSTGTATSRASSSRAAGRRRVKSRQANPVHTVPSTAAPSATSSRQASSSTGHAAQGIASTSAAGRNSAQPRQASPVLAGPSTAAPNVASSSQASPVAPGPSQAAPNPTAHNNADGNIRRPKRKRTVPLSVRVPSYMLRPGHVLDAEDTREIIELAKKVCGIKDDPFERFRGDPAGLRKFLKAENRREREEIRTEERERSRKLRNLERRVKYAQRQVHAMIHPRPPRPEMDGPVIVVVDPR